MEANMPIRVRIAPSPTGYLHLGTARAALFNFLFAKKEKGTFIIRIEDTDEARSLPIYENDILEGLKTLGIDWDEGPDVGGDYGPYRQSERSKIYEEYLSKLIKEKRAYWCFCSKEELEKEKEAMISSGLTPRYSGKCRHLSDDEIKIKLDKGESAVIRLAVPSDINVEFNDIIRGKISVNSNTIGGDIVIAKNINSPLYNFAVVIDDHLMNISHVIRGEDHISNTPKQILIQRALGFYEPKYAHLPLVLSPDRSKMSKRKMEVSFADYIKDGYLPEAIVNFLVLLGWHPDSETEVMSLDEMVQKFSLKKVQKGGAVFNIDKLDWFNAQYIKKLSVEELAKRLEGIIPSEWSAKKDILIRTIEIEKERMKKLSEFKDLAGFFFAPDDYQKDLLKWKEASFEKIKNNLEKILDLINEINNSDFSLKTIEEKIMPLADSQGRGEMLWPLRVALSGRKASPGPFEIMEVLGKEESVKRIKEGIVKIS